MGPTEVFTRLFITDVITNVYFQVSKPTGSDSDDEVIITSIGFADRQASQLAAVQFDTAKAIADLYAHVSQMPDSAYKRRLMKQVSLCSD